MACVCAVADIGMPDIRVYKTTALGCFVMIVSITFFRKMFEVLAVKSHDSIAKSPRSMLLAVNVVADLALPSILMFCNHTPLCDVLTKVNKHCC